MQCKSRLIDIWMGEFINFIFNIVVLLTHLVFYVFSCVFWHKKTCWQLVYTQSITNFYKTNYDNVSNVLVELRCTVEVCPLRYDTEMHRSRLESMSWQTPCNNELAELKELSVFIWQMNIAENYSMNIGHYRRMCAFLRKPSSFTTTQNRKSNPENEETIRCFRFAQCPSKETLHPKIHELQELNNEVGTHPAERLSSKSWA